MPLFSAPMGFLAYVETKYFILTRSFVVLTNVKYCDNPIEMANLYMYEINTSQLKTKADFILSIRNI